MLICYTPKRFNSSSLAIIETASAIIEDYAEQALEAVIGQAANARGCPHFACKGYTSQSEMWRAAMRFAEYRENGQEPIIIHLGDHDPSGIDMTRDITERINDVFGVEVHVERIALNFDQIEEYTPPPNPAKMTDSRFATYEHEYGDESWELDALEPRILNRLILDTIDQYLDHDLYDAVLARQAEEVSTLLHLSQSWDTVSATLAKSKPKSKGRK
jgi:hypothetical protein